MSLMLGILIFLGIVALSWFASWAWRQIPTAQCTRCFSYDVEDLAEGETGDCRCRDCGCEFLA